MNRDELESSTKRVFHDIHVAQGDNAQIFNRLKSLLTTEYLNVSADWFAGKTCLDAGCGSNANATYAMLEMGAQKVCAFDLGEETLQSAPKYLAPFAGRYALTVGNVLAIDYPDSSFDFVHCAGVLHHTADVFQGLSELARVTRPGGMLVTVTYGKGGIVRDVVTLLRNRYASDAGFKRFIDTLDAEYLANVLEFILTAMRSHGDELGSQQGSEVRQTLIDRDLVLTIKDRITAPVYSENSEEELTSFLAERGFGQFERLTRYPRYSNLRRFLSPLYERFDHPFARLLYGSGVIQLKSIKQS
jgi:ubiquinone/menaquinone biosynthesis C-methylase UbiE